MSLENLSIDDKIQIKAQSIGDDEEINKLIKLSDLLRDKWRKNEKNIYENDKEKYKENDKEYCYLKDKIHKKITKIRIKKSFKKVNDDLKNLPPHEAEYEEGCIKNWYKIRWWATDSEINNIINNNLEEEENELRYQTPFLHRDVKKDEKGRPYILSDHSRRKDQKYYLKQYPSKRLLAMHDFTPKEKKMREEIKETKDS